MTPRIRSVELDDLLAVRRVLVDTWHHTYDAIMGVERVTAITDDWHAIEVLRSEVHRPSHAFVLAELDGQVVATGSATRDDAHIEVRRIYVHPTQQGRGLGTALLDAMLAQLGSVACVELDVHVENARSIAFYERRGFVACGRDDDEHLRMRRRP